MEKVFGFFARMGAMAVILTSAVTIRLHAVNTYGRVIHEFDPWFNFRATQYLVDNGYEKFNNWYDEEVWYPLGRPVGSTLYPGMMFTSKYIFDFLNYIGYGMSLNDVCVFVPAWFSVPSVLAVYGLTYEVYRSKWSALAAAGFMAILPAHLMRSVAGGYDNESIAVAAICLTFYLWVRSLRTPTSWPFAFLCALSYTYMVAAWGAYTFVLNMIGVHAGVLVLMGRFSGHLHTSYSIFYFLGTLGALQVSVPGGVPQLQCAS
jgi:dolichyl-diphosphooligosaccharide--protein glycosyltransferase